MSFRLWGLSALAIHLVVCSLLFAQGTDLSNLRGTVLDRTDAAVPNAKITATDITTGRAISTMTDTAGNYEFSNLRTGSYTVTVSMTGFTTLEIRGVILRAGETGRADARLEVAQSAESVTVVAEAGAITTESPVIANSLNNAALVELPRDSRDIYSFLYLSPNISRGATEGSFKFIGAQSYGASFSLDGQRSNGGVFGEPTQSQPSLETIGELTVLSNNFSAEYAGIANVRVTTRRGGSAYRGSIFYNNKNSALAAWDLRDKVALANFVPTSARSEYTKPYFNLNEFGGSFGGPVPKVKSTYFFTAYERRLQNSPAIFRSTTLAHPSTWTGDFSRVNDNVKPVVPAAISLTPDEIAQNTVNGAGARFIRIPSRLLSPYTTALVKDFFPADASAGAPINPANGRLVDYYTNSPGRIRRHLGTMRVDHDFSENDRIYGVFNVQDNTQGINPVVSPFSGLGLTQENRSNQTFSVSEVHLFTPTLINEVRGGFNRQPLFRRSNQTLRDFLSTIGFNATDIDAYGAVITPTALDTFGHPAVTFGSGLQNFTNGGRNTFRPLDQNLFTIGDTITWVKGKHTIKAGADVVRNAAVDGFTSGRGNPRGLMTYTGAGLDAFARFLMGMAPNRFQNVNKFRPPMDVQNWETGFFVLDDIRLTPKLTINLGLRYEVITPFTENNDLFVNFDPKFVAADGRNGRFVVPSEKTLEFIDPRFVTYGVATAKEVGVPRQLVRTDRNNFAPRIGVAWRVTEKTVLRGGYGIFYPTSAAQGIRDPLATNSFQVGLTRNSTAAAPLSAWPRPATGGALTTLGGLISGNWVPFDLQQPRIQQYNVTFERDVGWDTAVRVSYLGTRMSNLISGRDANMIRPNDTPFGTTTGDGITACNPDDGDCDLSAADLARLPYPGLSDFLISFGNVGTGRSNAFQSEVTRRFSGGLMMNFSYTYLDQKSDTPDTGNSSLGGSSYDPFSARSDFGEDGYVSRHRFIAYGNWETPFGHGRRFGSSTPKWVDMVAGGWGVSWQMFSKSGTAFTPVWQCDNCGPFYPGNVASGNLNGANDFNGGFRPTVTGDVNVKSGDRMWDPAAFGLPPLGADLFTGSSVATRNLLRGPGTTGVNLGARKSFRCTETIRAELGADINNLFNHPLLSPDANNTDFYTLGSFSMKVNPATLRPEYDVITLNPLFGRLINSFAQENIDSRRAIRLRLRITF